MSAAHARLLQTFDDVLDTKPNRTSYVLQRPTTYRHIIMSDNPAATAVQIRRSGALIHSTGGNAHYGRGAYVYGEGRGASSTGSASYVDIQVPAGVAVERIVVGSQEPFFRLLSATGNSVPGRIVGTNIPADFMKKMELLIDGAR